MINIEVVIDDACSVYGGRWPNRMRPLLRSFQLRHDGDYAPFVKVDAHFELPAGWHDLTEASCDVGTTSHGPYYVDVFYIVEYEHDGRLRMLANPKFPSDEVRFYKLINEEGPDNATPEDVLRLMTVLYGSEGIE